MSLDATSIDIPCKHCGRKTQKSIGWIKTHNEFTCACGTRITLDASQFKTEIVKAERSLSALRSALQKLGKR